MSDAASASAYRSGSDELGVYACISVDPKVFGETAILKTAYWFTDRYYLFLTKNKDTGLVEVEFRLKQGESLDSLKAACGEFSNGLLDQSVRQRVLEETAPVRDTLLKKAFFEARATTATATVSDESYLPEPGQSHRDDPAGAKKQD